MADYITVNGELYHHGILGMKWGRRRYQNKDGTLTPAGKKRYDKEMEKLKAEQKVIKSRERTQAKIDKLNALKKDNEERKVALGDKPKSEQSKDPIKQLKSTKPKTKKKLSEMTDEELATAVRRAQLEKQYKELHPQEVSAGRKYIQSTLLPRLTQSATSLAVDYAMKKGKEYLGLSDKKEEDPLQKLRKTVEKMDLEKRYKEHKNPKSTDPVDELAKEVKRRTLEKQLNKLLEEENK